MTSAPRSARILPHKKPSAPVKSRTLPERSVTSGYLQSSVTRLGLGPGLQIFFQVGGDDGHIDLRRVYPVEPHGLEFPFVVLEAVPAHRQVSAEVKKHVFKPGLGAFFLESGQIELGHAVERAYQNGVGRGLLGYLDEFLGRSQPSELDDFISLLHQVPGQQLDTDDMRV